MVQRTKVPPWEQIVHLNPDCLHINAEAVFNYALVIHRTVLHNLSVLVIRRTTQINSRPMEIIIYSWQQNGDVHGL